MTTQDRREDIGQHLVAMRAFALSLTHDPALADDIVQDAVVKAWVRFETYKDGTNLRAWLFAILRNTFLSQLRQRKRDPEHLEDVVSCRFAGQAESSAPFVMSDFMKALRSLSFDQRESLLLVGALGFSYQEAAELCGVPLGTMKSRTHRARVVLAERLEIDVSG